MSTPATAQISHAAVVATYPGYLLDAVIEDLGKRNLSKLGDHDTRWMAERLKAARAERKARKLKNPHL